jgi:hypothetical protein
MLVPYAKGLAVSLSHTAGSGVRVLGVQVGVTK